MNMLAMKGNWNIAIGWAKQKLGRLTHNNMQFIKGMKDEMTGRIQKRAAQEISQFGTARKNAGFKSHHHFKS